MVGHKGYTTEGTREWKGADSVVRMEQRCLKGLKSVATVRSGRESVAAVEVWAGHSSEKDLSRGWEVH